MQAAAMILFPTLCLVAAACDAQRPAVVSDFAAPDMAPTCPNDLPPCPAPPPSWSGAVSAIVVDACASCHAPGGDASEKPLTTYAEVFQRHGTVLTEVYACQMPPATEPQLSDSDRRQLLGWLVCGAPNN